MEKRCENCKEWEENTDNKLVGFCEKLDFYCTTHDNEYGSTNPDKFSTFVAFNFGCIHFNPNP